MSEITLPYALGAVKDEPDARDFPIAKLVPFRGVLPPSVDYQAAMSPVKDQGGRGACVAFATVAVKEYQELKERAKRIKTAYDLSEEWIYEQIRLEGGGAYIRDGVKTLQKMGVPRESMMPYDERKSDYAPVAFNPNGRVRYNASFYRGGAYARLMTVAEMKLSLYQNGPFVYGVDWRYGWFNPNNRDVEGYPVLLNDGSEWVGGHAIAIVGYDDSSRTMKFKNSWGLGWGKNGYGKFSYDTVETHLLDAWATVDLPKG